MKATNQSKHAGCFYPIKSKTKTNRLVKRFPALAPDWLIVLTLFAVIGRQKVESSSMTRLVPSRYEKIMQTS